jgi:hypothetical protein
MMDMKDLGLFSGELEFDTRKFQDQLNAISMAAGALAHNLKEIDATYAEGETGLYTKTMVDPVQEEVEEAVKEVSIEYGDVVMIRYAHDMDGVSGTFAKVVGIKREEDPTLHLQIIKPCAENSMHYKNCTTKASRVALIAKAVK